FVAGAFAIAFTVTAFTASDYLEHATNGRLLQVTSGFWIASALAGVFLSLTLIWNVQNAETDAFLFGEKVWLQLSLFFIFLYNFMSLVLQATLQASPAPDDHWQRKKTVRHVAWAFLTISSAG